MKKSISSAGLLYLYLNGYEEDGIVYMQQVNTYNHIENGFYQRLMDSAKSVDNDKSIVHIFAVIGIKDKANKANSLIVNELKSNYQRMLSKKRIKKASARLDTVGNAFNRCVQEFFVNNRTIFQSVFTMIAVNLAYMEYVATMKQTIWEILW